MMWLLILMLSASLGSFANVLIYRLPKMILADEETRLNLSQPASFCPNCHSPLRYWHNIPLFSFIFLKRRCNQCGVAIAWQYFFVELGSICLGFFCVLFWGWTINAAAFFIFMYLLWVLAWIDALHYLLPDLLTHLLLWIGLLYHAIFSPYLLVDAVFASVFGFVLLFAVYIVFYALTAKQGLGFGDMKLLAAIGAWLGMLAIANILIISCFFALLYAMILRLTQGKQANRLLPFGPFLAIGAAVVLIAHFDIGMWLY